MLRSGEINEMRVARNLCENLLSSNVITKRRTLKKQYENAMIRISDAHIKKVHLVSSSKGCVDDSKHRAALRLLSALHISARVGNDAPRGGRGGDYIMIDDRDCARWAAFVRFFSTLETRSRTNAFYFCIEKLNNYLRKHAK